MLKHEDARHCFKPDVHEKNFKPVRSCSAQVFRYAYHIQLLCSPCSSLIIQSFNSVVQSSLTQCLIHYLSKNLNAIPLKKQTKKKETPKMKSNTMPAACYKASQTHMESMNLVEGHWPATQQQNNWRLVLKFEVGTLNDRGLLFELLVGLLSVAWKISMPRARIGRFMFLVWKFQGKWLMFWQFHGPEDSQRSMQL